RRSGERFASRCRKARRGWAVLSGINLTLMVGPAVPIPVPQIVLDALTSVTVSTSSGTSASGFELAFTLSNKSPLQTIFLLAGGAMPPILRVLVVVTMNGAVNVLMDGVALETTIAPGSAGTNSTLTV